MNLGTATLNGIKVDFIDTLPTLNGNLEFLTVQNTEYSVCEWVSGNQLTNIIYFSSCRE